MLPQNMPLWHNDCFKLRETEKKQIQEKIIYTAFLPGKARTYLII